MNHIEKIKSMFNERDAIYDKIAHQSGLSSTSFVMLYFIRDEKTDTTQAKIADDYFYPRQSINSAVAKLVEKGYVELITQKTQGHYKLCHLTEKGVAFCTTWIDPLIQAEEASYTSLSASDHEKFMTLYEQQLCVFKEMLAKNNMLPRKEKQNE